MAPCLFTLFEKIPMIKVGKKEEAAKPKAKATVLATKAGGWVDPEISRHENGAQRSQAGIANFHFVRDVGLDDLFHQIVGDGGREHE